LEAARKKLHFKREAEKLVSKKKKKMYLKKKVGQRKEVDTPRAKRYLKQKKEARESSEKKPRVEGTLRTF